MTGPLKHGEYAGSGRLISVEPDGLASIEVDGELWGMHLHSGIRMAAFGVCPVDPTKGVVSLLGGHSSDPGFEEDGVLFAASPRGLRAFAADLINFAVALETAGCNGSEGIIQ